MPRLVIAAGVLTGLFALSLLAQELENGPPNRVLVPLHGLDGEDAEQAVHLALSGITGVAEVEVLKTDVADSAVVVSMHRGAGLRLSDVARSLAEASEEMATEGKCEIDGDALRLCDGTSIAVAGLKDEASLQALLQGVGSGVQGAEVQSMEPILLARLRIQAGSVVAFMDLVRALGAGGGQVVDVMFLPEQPPVERETPGPAGEAPPAPQGGGC